MENKEETIQQIDQLLSGPSTIQRDIKLNLKRLLFESSLSADEAFATLLALATATDQPSLSELATSSLQALGVEPDKITESQESAAIMGMLNVYYRFKHLLSQECGAETADEYGTAGLRMTSLARPALGKTQFEMLAFALSVLNGCGTCIASHEKVLRQAGIETAKIHDLARLAAVVKACESLKRR